MDDGLLTFEVFGLLDGVLTMIDRETGTVWNHLDGKATRGTYQGARMTMIPMFHMAWGDWKSSHPETTVLSPDTPFQDRYRPVTIGRFNPSEASFGDDRLASNALVVGVEVDGHFKGYPIEELLTVGGVLNDTLGDEPIVVIYDEGASMGLAYSRMLNGEILELFNTGAYEFSFQDEQTGSTWNRQGIAADGPLQGNSLAFVPSFISEWYGWSGYHPETVLFKAD